MILGAPKVVKNSSNITFSWTKPTGAPPSGYQFILQYGTDQTFANAGVTTTVTGQTGLTYIAALAVSSPVKTYYWRIKMTNAANSVDFTDWATAIKFPR